MSSSPAPSDRDAHVAACIPPDRIEDGTYTFLDWLWLWEPNGYVTVWGLV